MKIINLKAENVKKLVAVDITPDENMVVISGKNGAGKSSLLDSIYYALAGKSVIPQKPIRDGEEKAVIQLDLGEVVVERIFTEKGTTVKVSTADGARYQKPQELLDQLLSTICFDPLSFSRLKPKDQYEEMKVILGFGEQIEQIEARRKEAFDNRREVNRSLKDGESYVESLKGEIPDNTPDEAIDVNAEVEQLQQLSQQIQDRSAMDGIINSIEGDISNITTQIEQLQEKLSQKKEALKSNKEAYEKMPKPSTEDRAAIDQKIKDAAAINEAVSKKHTLQKYIERVDALQKSSDAFTADIEAADQEKLKLLQGAKMPVEGLDLKDGQVFYNDLPFEQLCSAEKLRISTALAMSANPKLRIVRIQDGALLDGGGMETLAEMARENDFQVWIERVDSTDPVSIIIEDGQVKAADKPQPKKEERKEANDSGNNDSGQSQLAV